MFTAGEFIEERPTKINLGYFKATRYSHVIEMVSSLETTLLVTYSIITLLQFMNLPHYFD